MRLVTERLLKWFTAGMTSRYQRQQAIFDAADMVDDCLAGIEPDWRTVKSALEVYAADPAIAHHLRKFTTAWDMDMRAGRRAYLAGYEAHLRAFRRYQREEARRYVITNEPEELDAPLGIGWTGLDGAEIREMKGVQ